MNRSAPTSQASSAAQASNYDAADHHTPITTNTVPSSSSNAGASTTPSHETHSHSSTPHAASSGTGNHNTSEAAAGLGSDPWEGKELPSQQAKNEAISAHEGAGADVDGNYPEQRHAGSVGLGPNYKNHPNMADKVGGTMEEIKGKILRKVSFGRAFAVFLR